MIFEDIVRQKTTSGIDYIMVIKDLMGELDAIQQYDSHIMQASNNTAKNIWMHIRNDELTHAGMLLGLLQHLKPEYIMYLEKGHQEFLDLIDHNS